MNPSPSSPAKAEPSERPAWQRYGFAAAVLGAALLGRRALDPYTPDAIPLATIYLAVAFAVWFGGWKPAVAVTLAGYVAGLWWFFPPRHAFKLWTEFGAFRTLLYFSSCGIMIHLCESMRRAERRHAAAEAKVLSILDHMREGFCAVDREWRLRALNRSAEAVLQTSRATACGRTWWSLRPAIAGTAAETQLRRAMAERIPVQFETSALAAGAWHAVTATPSPEGLSLFFHDITAQKAQIGQLEQLVDDRTAALQQLVAELETFSYTLVHDMRAPLRSISGFAAILATDHAAQLDEAGRYHLGRIARLAARMDRLILDVLDYSRLTRGRPELGTIDLDETVRDMLQAYPDFHPSRADIAIDGVLPKVRGNDALLTQCFSNLLQNATKFVAPGVRPRVRIAAQVGGDSARVDIVDNGIGIDASAIERIFEPFQREDPSYEGTGIGLAIVRKVVEQLEGRVGVESAPGRGSRFWVELKLR